MSRGAQQTQQCQFALVRALQSATAAAAVDQASLFLLVWRLGVRIEGLAIRPCFGFTLLHDAKRTLIHPGTDIAGSLVCAGYTNRETTISKATIANIKAATNKKRGVRLLAGDGRHPILPHWQV
jgi:hypothetical protein